MAGKGYVLRSLAQPYSHANLSSEEFLQPSDEEVLGYSDSVDDVDDDDEAAENIAPPARSKTSKRAGSEDSEDAREEDEDAGGWGSSKQDYYDADVIETEQDALDEEVEAKRIQQKQLQAMTAADYGFDEDEWQDAKEEQDAAEEENDRTVVTEKLPELQIAEDMGPTERLRLLKSRYPEFEPLSKDFLDLQDQAGELNADALEAQKSLRKHSESGIELPTSVAVIKSRAASAYVASLTMYFALLTSTAEQGTSNGLALSAAIIRDHPIMDSLLKCRELWLKVKDLEVEESEDELSEDMEDNAAETEISEPAILEIQPKTKGRRRKAQRLAEAAEAEAASRRADRLRRTEASLADLDTLLIPRKANTKTSTQPSSSAKPDNDASDSDFGDETDLTAHDLAEKAKRKKSLRFYTSQIAQKANKRGAAGRATGGDDDVPYRERLKDRQARLNAEAEARGKKARVSTAGDDLGGESDDEDRRQARELRDGAGGDEDEYYDLVASRTAMKKSEKKALAAAQKAAAEQGGRVVEKEEVGADGKRAITYLIEKNKGLTPHRKKDVRNPRVKKRKKYEEKKKKLASIKPVFKGGEGRGGYGGELTGIKAGLIRSRKL